MSRAFNSIKQGLTEAIAYTQAKDKPSSVELGVKIYKPQAVDVSSVRQHLSMTQQEFAARFGFSVATLRHWERGDRSPNGASLVLLNVISRNPQAVMQALD